MTPADLSSLADDLEKRCENVDQLDFLVGFLAWLCDQSVVQCKQDLYPNDFAVLADHCLEMADKFAASGLDTETVDGIEDSALADLHAILGAKYCKAVGRA